MQPRVLLAAAVTFLGWLAVWSTAATPAAQSPPVDLTGTWNGTATDHWQRFNTADGMIVSWVLTQNGSAVSGTVTTTGLNGNDNSCSGCHRAKTGSVSGTLSGTTLTLTMDFPGHPDEPSPTCTASFSTTSPATIDSDPTSIITQPASQLVPAGQATALSVTPSSSSSRTTLQYAGSDLCEGAFDAGSLPMTRTVAYQYQWYAGPSGITSNPIAGATSSTYTTPPVTATTNFWVRVTDTLGGTVDSSTATLTPYRPSTIEVLSAGVSVIRAAHIEELRTRIDALRARLGLAAYPYEDASLIAGTTGIRTQHIIDLRAALGEAYVASGRTPPIYSDPALTTSLSIKLAHIAELWSALTIIE